MGVSTFASQAFSDFQATAAIVPSSRYLAEAMVMPLHLEQARVVVEFGPGTGVMTKELLKRMPKDSKLLAFEVNPRFVDFLRRSIPDPRLEVIDGSAEYAEDALAERAAGPADAALSSLGLSLLPHALNEKILAGAGRFLAPGAALTQFQYVHRIRLDEGRPAHFCVGRLMQRHFAEVERRLIVRNLPPAFVYTARKVA